MDTRPVFSTKIFVIKAKRIQKKKVQLAAALSDCYNKIMISTLRNETITIRADTCGAELKSLFFGGREYLWQGGTAWGSSSPVLFPFAGRRKNFSYLCGGKTYPMPLNGFAKDMVFERIRAPESLAYTLTDSEKTRAQYPYRFRFDVCYTLENGGIKAEFSLENRNDRPMPYMWGLHPGFRIEGPQNWELSFERRPTEYLLDKSLLLTGEKTLFPQRYKIGPAFAHARILADYGNFCRLSNAGTGRAVTLFSSDPDVVVLWRPPIDDVPLIAIEPWCGISDTQTPGDILQNPHVRILAPNRTEKAHWMIVPE